MSDDPIVGEVVVVSTGWYSLRQVCEICGIDVELVAELAAHGVITPPGDQLDRWNFSEYDLLRSKKAIRLRNDLGVDWPGLALALDLLDETERLRAQIAQHRGNEDTASVDTQFTDR